MDSVRAGLGRKLSSWSCSKAV